MAENNIVNVRSRNDTQTQIRVRCKLQDLLGLYGSRLPRKDKLVLCEQYMTAALAEMQQHAKCETGSNAAAKCNYFYLQLFTEWQPGRWLIGGWKAMWVNMAKILPHLGRGPSCWRISGRTKSTFILSKAFIFSVLERPQAFPITGLAGPSVA